ncbi:MAG: HAMP domain-containing protein [Candidatus Omnitrophica bacterium]|nr:HAMP domain-containing protein [Candidatus Omnitrophota bacterium]
MQVKAKIKEKIEFIRYEFKDLSILYKYVIVTSVLLIVAIVSSSLFFLRQISDTIYAENMMRLETLSSSLAQNSKEATLSWDYTLLVKICANVLKEKDVIHLTIFDGEGRIIGDSDETRLGKEDIKLFNEIVEHEENSTKEIDFYVIEDQHDDMGIMELRRLIKNDDKVIGALVLETSNERIHSLIRKITFELVMLSLGLMIFGLIVTFFFARTLTRPIKKLISATAPLCSGDLTQLIDIKSKDEIGKLADAFNQIIESMNKMVLRVRITADKLSGASEQVSKFSQQMDDSSQKVSKAIKHISEGAAVQSERSDEAYQISEKSSKSLERVLANSQVTTEGVALVSSYAEKGNLKAKNTVEKLVRLTNTVTHAVEVIQSLGEKSKRISNISATITSIADQTNLLSLNAAIEAARAGDAGRGFAVVAEEVKKLALASAAEVGNIKSLIRAIQSETSQAVEAIIESSDETLEGKQDVIEIAESLNEINQAVRDTSILTDQIFHSTQEQVHGASEVVEVLKEVNSIAKGSVLDTEQVGLSVSEQNDSVEAMSFASQELSKLAIELKELMSVFKLKRDSDDDELSQIQEI